MSCATLHLNSAIYGLGDAGELPKLSIARRTYDTATVSLTNWDGGFAVSFQSRKRAVLVGRRPHENADE